MANGDNDNSGELSSFLHLTGWRPLVLALVAGLAGAFGLFGALSEPAEWQARYIVNVNRVADDDLTPAELDIFVEEVAQTMKLPVVIDAVEERTGLVEEEDYDITVNQSAASVATIDVNTVSENPTDAQTAAIETGIEGLAVTFQKTLGGLVSGAEQTQETLDLKDTEVDELTIEAGGLNPTVAYDIAVQLVIERRQFLINRPTEDIVDADGNVTTQLVEEPAPSLEVLEAEVNRLEPIDRRYRQLVADIDALNIRLSDRQDSIRDATAAAQLIEVEREQPLIMSEVVTEETSRIASLLSGLLLFAVPAALLTILGFTIFDFFRKKPDDILRPAEEFHAAGVLEAQGTRALPEANFTPLVVVDENESTKTDVLNNAAEDVEAAAEEAETSSGDSNKSKRSKDGRWGRDASSKAG